MMGGLPPLYRRLDTNVGFWVLVFCIETASLLGKYFYTIQSIAAVAVPVVDINVSPVKGCLCYDTLVLMGGGGAVDF